MNHTEHMKKLKQRYLELVEKHGEETAGLKTFQKSLRKLNEQHRLNAIKMYEEMISTVESKAKAKS